MGSPVAQTWDRAQIRELYWIHLSFNVAVWEE